ncbi:phage holin family protein [Aliifodinibius sp. S!AR15-10]|uniref:phage holin family protein n=1 Tax=Aliifodinibius sp. S!AR15-10 TaxID=2950437 RepID=UPI0028673051|nr:phage holin family protein [Aliifodinibius sp. S!AR15-10]MDR8390128.1 phage holin family protein [Aliifodinibius sp. S!AR15-10]
MSSDKNDPLSRRLKTISGDLKLYVEKRVELLMLNVGEHISRMIAESVQKVAGIIMLTSGAVFLLVALALFLGDLLDNESLGYILVSLPLIVAGFMFYYLKPKSMLDGIQNHFEKEIIKAISENKEHKNERLMLKTKETDEPTK